MIDDDGQIVAPPPVAELVDADSLQPVNRPGSSCRATTRSTMLPTACHEMPVRRLTAVRSMVCARYATISSHDAVNALPLAAHETCSTRTPQ